MARSKKKSVLSTAPVNTAIKVLKAGRSWHGGEHVWSLPTQHTDGTWTPGEWTARVRPVLCEAGWHLTEAPVAWWGDGENVTAYLAEIDGAVDGPKTDATDDTTKVSVERCRLLRPLTRAELESRGIYLTGEHARIVGGRVVIGGDAKVEEVIDARVERMDGSASVGSMYGSARVGSMDGSARVERMYGSASVERMYGSARVGSMDGSARVGSMYGSASVGSMYGSARVERMYGSASVGSMYGSARVGSMDGSASVGSMYGSARVERMDGSARVGSMYGSASVERMYGSASVGSMYGSARVGSMYGSASVGSMYGESTAHASGEAVIVVRYCRPSVTVSGRASVLDYRPARPAHYTADPGMVLSLSGDGTVSQVSLETAES